MLNSVFFSHCAFFLRSLKLNKKTLVKQQLSITPTGLVNTKTCHVNEFTNMKTCHVNEKGNHNVAAEC